MYFKITRVYLYKDVYIKEYNYQASNKCNAYKYYCCKIENAQKLHTNGK